MAEKRTSLARLRSGWKHRHLLGIEDLSRDDIQILLDAAESMRSGPDSSSLKGKTIALLFIEPSTRTKLSFTLAARALGAATLDFSPSTSSLTKGESLKDTALTIEAMGVHAFVVRHSSSGAPQYLSRLVRVPVLNAGDGTHEHPSQALTDLFTLREAFGKISGRHVAIVGDIVHSRVARSNYHALTKMGARVTFVGPSTFLPHGLNAELSTDLDAVLPEADAVMMLRVQLERGADIPDLNEYRRRYELTLERLEQMKPGAVVLHPGPMNRDVEICAEAADAPNSLILKQVANGVLVRTALLDLFCSGESKSWEPSSSKAARSSTRQLRRTPF